MFSGEFFNWVNSRSYFPDWVCSQSCLLGADRKTVVHDRPGKRTWTRIGTRHYTALHMEAPEQEV
jgi:hypothetical protein